LRRAELNSWEAEISNAVRTYQDFSDRNLALRKREDELQLSINELEVRRAESQKTMLKEPLLEFEENNAYNDNLNLEVKQDDLSLPGGGSHKILDTAELFHANLAIDDITLQECSESKEKSSGSGIWPR
jgi:hypothetical protein